MHLTRLLTLLVMELRADFSPRKRALCQLQQKILDFSGGEKKIDCRIAENTKVINIQLE